MKKLLLISAFGLLLSSWASADEYADNAETVDQYSRKDSAEHSIPEIITFPACKHEGQVCNIPCNGINCPFFQCNANLQCVQVLDECRTKKDGDPCVWRGDPNAAGTCISRICFLSTYPRISK